MLNRILKGFFQLTLCHFLMTQGLFATDSSTLNTSNKMGTLLAQNGDLISSWGRRGRGKGRGSCCKEEVTQCCPRPCCIKCPTGPTGATGPGFEVPLLTAYTVGGSQAIPTDNTEVLVEFQTVETNNSPDITLTGTGTTFILVEPGFYTISGMFNAQATEDVTPPGDSRLLIDVHVNDVPVPALFGYANLDSPTTIQNLGTVAITGTILVTARNSRLTFRASTEVSNTVVLLTDSRVTITKIRDISL